MAGNNQKITEHRIPETGGKKRLRLNIGVRFISFAVLVALLTGVAVGFMTINSSRNSLRLQVLQNNLNQAELASEFASNYVAAVQAHVRVFAARPDIRQAVLNNTMEQMQPTLAGFVEIQTALDSSNLYNSLGIQLASATENAATIGQSFADREWFRGAVNTLQPYLGLPVQSRVTGQLIMPYIIPILNDKGDLSGLLGASISLAKLSDAIVKVTYGTDTSASIIDFRSGGLIIADREAQLIMTPAPAENEAVIHLLAGESSAIEIADSAGELDLIGFAGVTGLPWGVLVVTPSNSAMAPVQTLTRNASLITGFLILLAVLAGVFLMLGITRPLRRLVEGTKEIGSGNLHYQLDINTRDEVGDLSRAFRDMTVKLKSTMVSRDELALEVTERKRAEAAVRQSEEKYRNLFENAEVGMYRSKLDGSAMLDINKKLCEIFGYLREEMMANSATLRWANPDARQEMVRRLRETGELTDYEVEIITRSGAIKTCLTSMRLYPKEGYLEGSAVDITERKIAENKLKQTLAELSRSNEELQRFTYVASHDLQEPLRMVASYVQLLERRYKGKLDADADDFINFAVDGARRMQNLINDLLAYSRVGSRGKPFEPTSMEKVYEAAVDNLQVAIQENKAEVTHEPLPEVVADEGQMVQVLQNLIGNAIKFHGKIPPRVHVSSELKGNEFIFSVKDNGIGIEPQYFDRIFVIFQRLHGIEYAGTGAGLSIVKRIVERHGGRVWVESEYDKGSTFYFSIPEKGGNKHA